jgi:hypothetical protein
VRGASRPETTSAGGSRHPPLWPPRGHPEPLFGPEQRGWQQGAQVQRARVATHCRPWLRTDEAHTEGQSHVSTVLSGPLQLRQHRTAVLVRAQCLRKVPLKGLYLGAARGQGVLPPRRFLKRTSGSLQCWHPPRSRTRHPLGEARARVGDPGTFPARSWEAALAYRVVSWYLLTQ